MSSKEAKGKGKASVVGSTATSAASSVQSLPATNQPSIWYIKEGTGGTFSFGTSKSSLGSCNRIGTDGCVTCAGVYFEIKGNLGFAAHLNAGIKGIAQDNITTAEADIIKKAYVAKLRAHATAQGWDPSKVKKETIVIVCPNASVAPGAATVAAVKEFLGVANITANDKAHGFIVNVGSDTAKTAKLLNYKNPTDKSMGQYKPGDLKFGRNEWRFTAGKSEKESKFGSSSGGSNGGLDWGSAGSAGSGGSGGSDQFWMSGSEKSR